MLDQNASIPLYEQLKNAIRKEIDDKKYSSGDRIFQLFVQRYGRILIQHGSFSYPII